MRSFALALALLLSAMATAAATDGPVPGWNFTGPGTGYAAGSETAQGRKYAYIRSVVERPTRYAALLQDIAADKYRGKRVRLSAQLNVEGDRPAALFLNVGREREMRYGAFWTQDKGWKRYQIIQDIPADATSIGFGFAKLGGGRVLADSFALEVVGPQVPLSSFRVYGATRPVNLEFDR